jgi:thioredoxin reductase (NADPH)
MEKPHKSEVVIIGGGMAGLSAALYLARANRQTLLIDSGKSMARWEPDIQNFLGFPGGISGDELLRRGRAQARRYGAKIIRDQIRWARTGRTHFRLRGDKAVYTCKRLLIATGIFHIPPDIPGVKPCLGRSMFFCKDCDGFRVQGKTVAIYGWTNEAVEYALGMLLYSPRVLIVTDGRKPRWNADHQRWIREYKLPVSVDTITRARHRNSQILSLQFRTGEEVETQALFTTRGDVYHNKLAKDLGAKVDPEGQISVDADMRTTVPRLYAAGCVTPANCQMIIAAGQGAVAAQAINRDLFDFGLTTHALRRFRRRQVRDGKWLPRKAKQLS